MNKEQLKKGDFIEKGDLVAYVIDPDCKNSVKVSINGTKLLIPFSWLDDWNIANPIKDNRIVDSYTFAIRFKQFLDWIPKEFYMSGPHILEEYEYMQIVADNLLKYQVQTATDESEIDYLKRLNLWPQ